MSLFGGKIKELGDALVKGFQEKALDIEKDIQNHPELKAPFTLRAVIMKDIAGVIASVTGKFS